MPRARNIKPGFFTDAKLGKANPLLMILFASLWCLADREGRLKDDPEDIWAYTFPFRPEVKTDELLNELQRIGYIIRYKVGDSQIIQVKNFGKHQSPHKFEKQSVLPACDDNSLIVKDVPKITVEAPENNGISTLVKRPDSLIPDCGYLIPDTRYPIQKQKRASAQDLDFERFWQVYPKRPGANKTQAFKAWNARLNEGEEIIEMQRGAFRYRQYCEAENTEAKFIKQAATFLGPDKHYLSDWKTEGARNPNQKWLDNMRGKKGDDDGFTFDA